MRCRYCVWSGDDIDAHLEDHRAKQAAITKRIEQSTPMTRSEFQAMHAKAEKHDDLVMALNGVLDRYCELVNSGDAGYWNPETDDVVIQARAALAVSA